MTSTTPNRSPVSRWFISSMLAATVTVVLSACSESRTDPTAVEPPSRVITPACERPAPLQGIPNPLAPSFIVLFRSGVNAETEAPRLARVHGFTLTHLYLFATGGFAAQLTPQTLAAVRCEATVQLVEHDVLMTIN